MLRRITVVFSVVFCFAPEMSAQNAVPVSLGPLEVVERYISPDGFPDKLKYFCCEFYQEWGADSTLGQQLPKSVRRSCELLYADSLHAAVAVWLRDAKTSRDVYFYLVKNKNWTIYAARSLVMTADSRQALKALDTVPEVKRGAAYTKANGHSWEFTRNNLLLWGQSDSALAMHFEKQADDFLRLQRLLAKKGYYGKSDSLLAKASQDKKIRKLMDKLLIREIHYDKKYPGAVIFLVGGILDNTVGYIFQPDPEHLPRMSEKKFILLRPLGKKGWYLFKTT